MCTVILAWRVHPEVPLIVAANRDEFYGRPSAPPGPLPCEQYGPRDLRAGGTWMAVNRAGVVAALTNAVPPDLMPVEGIASRGEIIGRALQHSTAAAAAASVTAADPGRTRPFYLLFAGPDGAHAVSAAQGGWTLTQLDPGVHVQENRPLNDPSSEKVTRSWELTRELASWPAEELVQRLHAVLSDHDPARPELRRLCVHTDGYGTRSTSLVLGGGDGLRWWFLDGHPCEGSPQEVQVVFGG
jgi:uncharacterized protein with NRDE domain